MVNFDAKEVKNDIVKWIRNFFEENGKGCNAVIGVSGGTDSSVVAALCSEALGKDRVIGVLMPQYVQDDINFAYELVDFLGIKSIVVNIGDAVNEVLYGIEYGTCNLCPKDVFLTDISEQAMTNLPARIRMATLYAISQSNNGRVANTCNLSENWVGYSTRYGDSVGDFSPLENITKDEVIAIGKECGLPDFLLYKEPSDGLSGLTDEDNLGFSYAVLNRYIRTGICEDTDVKNKIDALHKKNLFKLEPMPCFEYNPE